MILRLALAFTLLSTALYINAQSFNYEGVSSKKQRGNFTEYTAQNGEVFKVGDTITLGKPYGEGDFKYVFQNTGLDAAPVFLNAVNHDVVIKKFKARSKKAFIYTTSPNGYVYGLIINVNLAISQGELQTSVLSSDEALEELKKWKDKLDLELITQEEYEEKKKELVKFIK